MKWRSKSKVSVICQDKQIPKLLIIVSVCFLLFGCSYFSKHKDMIYVVDISRSMTDDSLHKRVRRAITKHMEKYFKPGDGLALFVFGTSVSRIAHYPKASESQLEELRERILEFDDDWTYMTKAFADVSTFVRDKLQKDRLRRPIFIYLFTDGVNNPPKWITNPLSFDEVMRTHLGTYKKLEPYTAAYIVTLGIEPEDSLVILSNRSRGRIKVERRDAELEPHMPRIPVWIYIILALMVIAVIVIAWYYLTPRFPKRSYLLHLDTSGNEIGKFNLRRRQKPFRRSLRFSGDVKIPGVAVNTFCLFMKGGSVYIKTKQSMTLVETNEVIKTGKLFRLPSGAELSMGDKRFKYEIGG